MVRLDFIPDGSPDAPLLRFRGDAPAVYGTLHAAFLRLAEATAERIDLGHLPGVVPDGCRLTATTGPRDRGAVAAAEPGSFEWVLSRAGWADAAAALEPFCGPGPAVGFRWLDRRDVHVLVTTDGDW